jgi:hypothetical protein
MFEYCNDSCQSVCFLIPYSLSIISIYDIEMTLMMTFAVVDHFQSARPHFCTIWAQYRLSYVELPGLSPYRPSTTFKRFDYQFPIENWRWNDVAKVRHSQGPLQRRVNIP